MPVENKEFDLAEGAKSTTPEAILQPSLQHKNNRTQPKQAGFHEWLRDQGMNRNPFAFEIMPEAFVGYSQQAFSVLDAVLSGSKMALILGPTGSGKTTLLHWLAGQLQQTNVVIFLSKPPEDKWDLLGILNSYFGYGFFRKRRASTLYDIPKLAYEYRARNNFRRIVLICDEIHESSEAILRWLRVLSDSIEGMSVIMAALPRFERDLGERLETLRKRISLKISVLSLTKEETRQLIERRIAIAGGRNIFAEDMYDYIYEQSAGFPREILRICDSALQRAYETGSQTISRGIMTEAPSQTKEHMDISGVPDKQRVLLEALVNPETAALLSERFAQQYKSKQHALRAINNLLHRLMQQGLVEREHFDKTYKYKLSSKAKTAFVTK